MLYWIIVRNYDGELINMIFNEFISFITRYILFVIVDIKYLKQ